MGIGLQNALATLWDDLASLVGQDVPANAETAPVDEEFVNGDELANGGEGDSGGDDIDATLARARGCSKSELYVEVGLTPEEYVCELLSASDGRRYQGEIVEFTGWSSSSVSRLLCEMEDDGTVTRTQLGRRKIVFLPEHVPAMAKHPLERYAERRSRANGWDDVSVNVTSDATSNTTSNATATASNSDVVTTSNSDMSDAPSDSLDASDSPDGGVTEWNRQQR